jgi:3-deoxy-manno-octulosonate cytidylyltransferase (CMP-KDO synthetase)
LARLQAIGIIPARYGSTRLPGKPLALIAGQPLVWHVVERARAARRLSRVVVATDHESILEAVRRRGGEAMMTSPDHQSGTDRVAEAARGCDADLIVNVQGDEPLLEADALDRLVALFDDDLELPLATLRRPAEAAEMGNVNVVKVVCDGRGRALYFSRAGIPHRRGEPTAGRWAHVGVYAYRREALFAFAALPPSPLEREEGLEQLRAIEAGWRIQVEAATGTFLGVDTPEDLERARRILERPQQAN